MTAVYLLSTSYLFLVKYPDNLRVISDCAMQMRKYAVMQIILGPSTPVG